MLKEASGADLPFLAAVSVGEDICRTIDILQAVEPVAISRRPDLPKPPPNFHFYMFLRRTFQINFIA